MRPGDWTGGSQADFAGGWPPREREAGPLDDAASDDGQLRRAPRAGGRATEQHAETPQDSLDRLRVEVAELRASRHRLAVDGDADRRRLERELHDGPQQRLVALAVELQLAREALDLDPGQVKAILEDMKRNLQLALDEAGRLAHLIYPPLLEAGGLATALRAAAVATGARARIEVAPDTDCAPEVAGSIYFCWLDLLDAASAGGRASIVVRAEEGELAFDVDAHDAATAPDEAVRRVRDRVEALGGRLSVEADGAGGTRVSARLPVSR